MNELYGDLPNSKRELFERTCRMNGWDPSEFIVVFADAYPRYTSIQTNDRQISVERKKTGFKIYYAAGFSAAWAAAFGQHLRHGEFGAPS